ncbi:hypothetical protein UB46_20185 [Burkholderiaceae bacterium 16]|nr:hypothetical protein UB46_20185 [Burkholderiaceae bacterium 16]
MLHSPDAIRTVSHLHYRDARILLDTPDDQSHLNNITGGHDNYTIQLGHHESVPPAPQKPMASQHKSHRDGAA